MLIRVAKQFNPFYSPVFTAPHCTWKVPPEAFPLCVPFNNDGVFNHSIGGGGIHQPLFTHTGDTGGMEACPQWADPLFEMTSIVGYDYAADAPRATLNVVSTAQVIALPPVREFLGFEYGVDLPANTTFPTLINMTANLIPRWLYVDEDRIVTGEKVPFSISIFSPWSVPAGTPDGFDPGTETGTHFISLDWGIPYSSADTDGLFYPYDGAPPGHTPFIDQIYDRKLSQSGLFGNLYPVGAGRINGVWRDAYPVLGVGQPYTSHAGVRYDPIGFRLKSLAENLANNREAPFVAIYGTRVNEFYHVWKGSLNRAKPGPIGYIFHQDFAIPPPRYSGYPNPPAGTIWLIYDHAWSLP